MSRLAIPRRWEKSTARMSCWKNQRATGSGRRRSLRTLLKRLPLLAYSITMHRLSSVRKTCEHVKAVIARLMLGDGSEE